MKKNLVETILVVDRSGSMEHIKKSTIDGINEFLKTQRNLKKDVKVTIAQFDTEYNVIVENLNAKLVNDINEEIYIPRGGTALYDAIGTTIDSVGRRLRNTNESERPEKVIFVIITDGEENSSRTFGSNRIKEMIEEQRDKYNWDFVFLGANQDAILAAGHLGISPNSSMTYYANNNANTRMYSSLSAYVSNVAISGSAAFTLEDRQAQNDLSNYPTTAGGVPSKTTAFSTIS